MVGNRRFQKHRPLLRQLGLLLSMPLAVTGISYALFSQNLTLNGNQSSVAYVSNNYTMMTYTKTVTGTGPYVYTINPMTITNNGVTGITAWNVKVTVPADVTSVTCPTTITCSLNTTTDVLTITNGTGNGTIAAGGNTVINNTTTPIKFSTTTGGKTFVLQNVTISATYSTAYTTITGLTVVATHGTKSGGAYPLTVTITNNSGQAISGWQVTIPTTRTCTSTVPSGVTYTCTTTVLTYTGAAVAIAAGGQYVFNTSVTYTPTTWTTTGAAVKGKA